MRIRQSERHKRKERGMRTIPRLVIVLLSTGALVPMGAAAEPEDPPNRPAGWTVGGSHPAEYEMCLDRATRRSGKSSAVLRGKTPTVGGFGTLMQEIDAADYRGRRVRLSGFSKAAGVAGWAGLWMRVRRPPPAALRSGGYQPKEARRSR
jgi:hypothetical protein